jgi:hypothetical protein
VHRQCQITCSNPFWVSHSKGGAQLLHMCMKGVRCTCRRFLHTGLEQPCAYTPGAVEQHSGCRTGSLGHLRKVKCQPHTAPKSHSGPRNIQKLPHHIRYWIIAHKHTHTHTEPRCKSSVNHPHSQNLTESAAIMAGSSKLTDMSAQTRTNMSARAVQAAAEQAFAAAAVTRYNTHHAAAATAAATESRAAAAAITAAADGAKHRGDGHYTTTSCCCRTGSRVVSYRSWPL